HLEPAIGYLRVYLDDLQLVSGITDGERACQPGEDTGDVVFVHVQQSYLKAIQHVQLTEGITRGLVLADLGVKGGQLTVDRGTDDQAADLLLQDLQGVLGTG